MISIIDRNKKAELNRSWKRNFSDGEPIKRTRIIDIDDVDEARSSRFYDDYLKPLFKEPGVFCLDTDVQEYPKFLFDVHVDSAQEWTRLINDSRNLDPTLPQVDWITLIERLYIYSEAGLCSVVVNRYKDRITISAP